MTQNKETKQTKIEYFTSESTFDVLTWTKLLKRKCAVLDESVLTRSSYGALLNSVLDNLELDRPMFTSPEVLNLIISVHPPKLRPFAYHYKYK